MAFNIFPAFLDHPEDIRFAEQEKDEVIELFLRQHWVTQVGWIVTAFVLISVIPGFYYLNMLLLHVPFPLEILPDIQFAVVVIWYMIVSVYVIEKFLHWYFNIYIVTNKHIVDIDFYSLLSQKTTETELKDVQNLSASYAGILGPLFNFGNVVVETASKGRDGIEFLSVPKPYQVADRIQDLDDGQDGGSK